MQESADQYVSRGGLKLDAAIKAFDINCDGFISADFGCNVGGFTDCMLRFGAEKVYAVDTGYGTLAWTLRKDTRVVVMERTNALYAECPEPVDLVVVLDRSGSMNGQKIRDAKKAVMHLLGQLSPQDRIAIITYSNGVEILSPLVQVNDASREDLWARVNRINSGGGTNLGGGLKNGITVLRRVTTTDRQRKVILISDGLANHGITNPVELAAMAANGSEDNLAVSTVGVGYDFNEVLMSCQTCCTIK